MFIKTAIVILALALITSLPPYRILNERLLPKIEAKTNTYNMSYVYYGDTADLIQNVDETNGALQAISPSYLELNADGSLRIADSMDPAFIKAMHSRGINVIPYLGNEWSRSLAENALQNRQALATQIVSTIKRYDLDGINVDIENIAHSSRADLVDFIEILRSKLPAEKELSIAVSANPNGYADAYNLKALAASCDYIMLMAYDEHYPGDPIAGPVAGLPFVEQSIQYALTLVPPSQLVLGIPFYGRLWNGITAYNGTGLTNLLASTLAAKYGGAEFYDIKEQSVRSQFTIRRNDPQTKVLGQPLPLGSYTLWYENEQSLKAKLELVEKYQLKGTGSWSLNQAAAGTWSYYNSWSNGLYYGDLMNHWSQEAALSILNQGWMIGISARQFAPDQPLTRAQTAAILARIITNSTFSIKAIQSESSSVHFDDVSPAYWANEAIIKLVKLGILTGTDNHTFAPDSPITREELSVLLVRLFNFQSGTLKTPPFADVNLTRWSYSAIAQLALNHIINGYEDGTFHPDEQVTRAQIAVILYRIQKSENHS